MTVSTNSDIIMSLYLLIQIVGLLGRHVAGRDGHTACIDVRCSQGPADFRILF